MKNFLEKIERALNNPLYNYSYDNVVVVCQQVSKLKKITEEQRIILGGIEKRLKEVKYMNSYTGEINYTIPYRMFADVANDLYNYIEDELM